MQIYKLTNKVNGKSYIGATIQGIYQRMKEHRYQAKYDAKFAISQAIREFGMEAFDLEVLAEADSYEDLMQLEIAAIREHGTMSPKGYNNSTGGKGCPGHQKSVAGRLAISAASKGRILSEEHRAAIRHAQLGNQHAKGNRFTSPRKGIPLAQEIKARMSAAHKGGANWNAREVEIGGNTYPSVTDAALALCLKRDEVRSMIRRGEGRFLSLTKYGQIKTPRVFSEEHRAKLAAAKMGRPGNATGTRGHEPANKGMPRTEEEKAKMRAAQALIVNPKSRPIEINGIAYPSVSKAARELGLSGGKIHYWLKSGRARYLSPPHGGEPHKGKHVNMRTILKLGPAMGLALAFLAFFSPPPIFAQATTTSTTASAAIVGPSGGNPPQVCIASATGVVVPSITAAGTYLGVDQEAMQVMSAGSTSTCFQVRRGTLGTAVASHLSGATVWVGNAATSTGDSSRPFTGGPFITNPPMGSCVAANQFILPLILYGNSNQVGNGRIYTCTASGYWGQVGEFFVPPTSCTFVPTTLTQTTTYTTVGTVPIFVVNSVTNAAAGTDTLTCSILVPTAVTTNSGAILMDIISTIGSQTVAPTSLGTSTLGTINLPTPTATTQTASSNTLGTIGGTVTTLGPTTTVQTVTTAGTFLTFKHSYSTEVRLSTDLRPLVFTFPLLQSAASAMTVNSAGLLIHYVKPSGDGI